MEWDSPWGKGFPGWHIECSAMSAKYLGVPFDIHTGGIDHIPIHHMNEIAQTEAATGKLLANTWLHNEHLRMGEEKMAKSEGNVLSLDTLREEGIEPLASRYYLLNTHYRSAIDFSMEGLKAAQTAYKKLLKRVEDQDPPKIGCAEFESVFRTAVSDDLNTPKALGIMWDLLKSDYPSHAIHATLLAMDEVFGLGLAQHENDVADIPVVIRELLAERQSARDEFDFTSSDLIRERIEAEGWSVEDTPDGQRVRKK
jgi:cysteinyl-tRNA synthetase